LVVRGCLISSSKGLRPELNPATELRGLVFTASEA